MGRGLIKSLVRRTGCASTMTFQRFITGRVELTGGYVEAAASKDHFVKAKGLGKRWRRYIELMPSTIKCSKRAEDYHFLIRLFLIVILHPRVGNGEF